MKILYLINNLGSGGAQRQLLELSLGLDQDRFSPLICTYDPVDFYRDSERYSTVTRVCVPKSGKGDFRFVLRLAHLINERQIDLLHTYLMAPTLWGYLARTLSRRIPLICSERSDPGDGLLHWRYIRQAIFPRANKILCNSERAGIVLKAQMPQKANDIVVIPNGIDVDYWSAPKAPDPQLDSFFHQLPPADLTVVKVASFHPWKDHLTLIRSVRNLPNVRLILAGNAAVPEVVRQVDDTIQQLGLFGRVIRTDAVADIRSLYKHADVLALSSRFEGFPNVVLEGMAAGLPVLSTDVSDLATWITPGVQGFVVPVGDEVAMTNCLRTFASLPASHRKQMGEQAQQLARRFSIPAMVNQTQACYEDFRDWPHRRPTY